jgi:hypothetical protein
VERVIEGRQSHVRRCRQSLDWWLSASVCGTACYDVCYNSDLAPHMLSDVCAESRSPEGSLIDPLKHNGPLYVPPVVTLQDSAVYLCFHILSKRGTSLIEKVSRLALETQCFL